MINLFTIITFIEHPQSQIKVHYLADNQVRLQHVVESKDCFLVFENGQFRGSAPVGENELFQLERVDGYEVLKLVNYRLLEEEESSSGSGAGETNGTNVNATSTTEKPANTTDEPTDTTEEPASTTEEPANTTEEPASTTEEPASTTEEPTGATEGATEASNKPTDCYLGVSVDDSTLICYPSNDTDATKFLIIP